MNFVNGLLSYATKPAKKDPPKDAVPVPDPIQVMAAMQDTMEAEDLMNQRRKEREAEKEAELALIRKGKKEIMAQIGDSIKRGPPVVVKSFYCIRCAAPTHTETADGQTNFCKKHAPTGETYLSDRNIVLTNGPDELLSFHPKNRRKHSRQSVKRPADYSLDEPATKRYPSAVVSRPAVQRQRVVLPTPAVDYAAHEEEQDDDE